MLTPSEIRAANQRKSGRPALPDAAAPYSVSRLNREAKLLLEAGIPPLWLEAEVSNLARPASGHLYFTLKDSKAQIQCAMFRNAAMKAAVQPENGQQVLVKGSLSLYEARGNYQLIVQKMEPAGEGMLRQAYEQLKLRLEAEGLFDEAHKKELPSFPRRVGVVTSSSGAAIRDIITVFERRFPAIELIVYPAPVQGDEAPAQIVEAIHTANKRNEVDLLICGRGGGSLEDLWAFNNENVARAIFDSEIPVVSAVGHEVDYCIADFVADLRAPTPSAAAELCSPDQFEWLGYFSATEGQLKKQINARIHEQAQLADNLERRLRSLNPTQKLALLRQRLDHASYKLQGVPEKRHQLLSQKLERLQGRLHAVTPSHRLERLAARTENLPPRLSGAIQRRLEQTGQQLAVSSGKLNSVSPLATLQRGYSMAQDDAGNVISDTATVNKGDNIHLRMSQGKLTAQVTHIDD